MIKYTSKAALKNAEKIILEMAEGALCLLPSDSSYILTCYLNLPDMSADVNTLLKRGGKEMSLSFYDLKQVRENISLSENEFAFLNELTPGALSFVAIPRDDNAFMSVLSRNAFVNDGSVSIRLSDSAIERELARKFPVPSLPVRFADGRETADLKSAISALKQVTEVSDGEILIPGTERRCRLICIDGKIRHTGKLSTVVRDEKNENGLFIRILREGMISREKIAKTAVECAYDGVL